MRFLVLTVYFSLVFISCKDNCEQYKGYDIIIPDNIECLTTGADTISSKMRSSQYKYIVFVDSLKCSTCAIKQLPKWLNLVNYATRFPHKISVFFIFETKLELYDFNRKALLHADIYYPIFLDSLSRFRKANPSILNDKKVECIMVDSMNKVLFIGDILKNRQARMEFNNILKR